MMTKTTAQKIADQFDNDGMILTDAKNNDIEDVCERHAEYITHYHHMSRHEFADGTAIITNSDAWDIGFSAAECLDQINIDRVADSDGWDCPIEFVWPEAL